jgi:hypothetical protein
MAISVVNGFLCTCSCDVAKAKLGQDPHPAEHAARTRNERDGKHGTQDTTRADGPSVVFGGALSETLTGNAAAPASPGQATPGAEFPSQGSIVDILA